jgi:8-oxo-(d)GTP phosphatase
MEPVEERDFTPNDEVDELRWCDETEARDLLSYDHDRRLVAELPT